MSQKRCSRCGRRKPLSQFYAGQHRCKECSKIYNEENREWRGAYLAEYRQRKRSKELDKIRKKRYREKNRERYLAQQRERYRQRRAEELALRKLSAHKSDEMKRFSQA